MQRIRLVLAPLVMLLAAAGVLSAQVDLTVTKSDLSDPFVRGQTGTYNIIVSNGAAGSPTSAGITVTDNLPTGLTLSSFGGGGWNCVGGGNVTCTNNTLGVTGSFPTLSLTVDVGGNTASSVTNTATVSGGGELPAQTGNNSGNEQTDVVSPLNITTTSLPNGAAGVFYSQSLSATGGQTPYTWSLAPGSSLPSGLSISTTGVISGTPSANGTFNFTVRVTDNNNFIDDQPLSLTISEAPSITTTSLPNGTVNVGYSQALNATGGQTPYNWSLASGSLPGGLNLSGGGTISGTPNNSGTFNFTVRVTDANSATDDQPLSLTINPPLNITTTSLPSAAVGVNYSQTVNATGGQTPYSWSLASGSLPNGLGLNANNGTISGTPTGSGASNFTVRVTDDNGITDDQQLSIVVSPPVNITTTSLPNGTVGVNYSQTLSATNGQTPYTWSLASGSLPGGLNLSGGGTISGNPNSSGTFNFTVRVTDDNGIDDEQALSITINNPTPSISNLNPNSTTAGASGFTLTISGNNFVNGAEVNFGSGSALNPSNVTNSQITVSIPSGRVSSAGNRNVTVTNPSPGGGESNGLNFNVLSPPNITTNSLPNGTVGVSYSQPLFASGGQTPYDWDLASGSLPNGLNLSNGGTISGNPNNSGNFNFTVRVTDDNGVSDEQGLSLTINPPLNITTTSLPPGTVGISYNQNLNATGGQPGYTWSIASGSLPNGLGLNSGNGNISGTPSSAGTSNFTVRVTDQNNVTDEQALSITITAPDLTINKAHSGNFTAGESGNYTLTVSNGGNGSTSGAITVTDNLPTGLSFGNGSGSGWSCSAAGQTVTCTTTAVITPGSSAPSITLNVNVSPSAPANVINTASVAVGNEPSGNRGNNSDDDPTAINSNADLTISKSHTGDFVRGEPGTYMITVSNNGAGDSRGTVTMNDTLPAGLVPTTAIGTGWNCPIPTGQSVSCTRTMAVPAGGSAQPISITVNVAIDAPGNVTNTASVVNAEDINGGNNSASDPTNIINPLPQINPGGLSPLSAIAGGPGFDLTVTGTGFVPNSGVRWDNTPLPTTFVSPTQLRATVSADLIALAGLVPVTVANPAPAVGGGVSNTETFTVNNPSDISITSLNPNTVIVSSDAFQLTINGNNFVPSSAVRWNGQAIPATFVSTTQMTAQVAATLITAAGTAGVTVVNPPPGGGTSNVATFTINNPLPILTSLTPDGKSAAQLGFTMTLAGTGFIPQSQVRWNGTVLPVNFVSGTELQVQVLTELIAVPGTVSVTVLNPEPGGGVSNPRQFTIGDQLTISTESPLPNGTLGEPYSRTLTGIGGDPPYRWNVIAGSSLPAGLTLNTNTAEISGTPTEAGTFSFTIQVTDSLNVAMGKSFVLTISPRELLITTESPLPDATVTGPYSQTLQASGGTPPYVNWTITGGQLPNGLTINPNSGVISGNPDTPGVFNFAVTVTDNSSETATKSFTLTVLPPGDVLTILTTSCPAAFIGTDYTCELAASGGVPGYVWTVSAGELPTGLTLDPATGIIAGNPPSAGSAEFEVTVTDTISDVDTQILTVTVTAAGLTISVLGEQAPAQQNQVTLTLPAPFPSEVTGQLALSFTPDAALTNGGAGLDDPAIQFSTGGRTVNFSVVPGGTEANFGEAGLMIQTGTIAGTIQLTVTNLESGGSVITPSPAPMQTVIVDRQAPTISSIRIADRTANSFNIEVVGFATPREVTEARFDFAGQNLQGAQATIQLGEAAQNWYEGAASQEFGSQFIYVQPFTTDGDTSAISSVSVTLTNSLGSSAPATTNF